MHVPLNVKLAIQSAASVFLLQYEAMYAGPSGRAV